MSLNIKNEQTHAMVRELAELTDMTQTGAVEDAVRRRLDELRSAPTGGPRPPRPKYAPEELTRRIASMERSAAAFRSVTTAEQRAAMADHGAWLYDDAGLPR